MQTKHRILHSARCETPSLTAVFPAWPSTFTCWPEIWRVCVGPKLHEIWWKSKNLTATYHVNNVWNTSVDAQAGHVGWRHKDKTTLNSMHCTHMQCEPKKIPLEFFWHFPQRVGEFLVQILHAYYTFLSVLEYTFLFNYLQLWQNYAILSSTTQRAFQPIVDILSIWCELGGCI